MLRSVPRPLLTDAGLALLLIAITAVPMISVYYLENEKPHSGYPGPPPAFWWLASAVIVVGLLLRQRWPYAALVLVLAGVVAHSVTVGKPAPLALALPVVLYSAAAGARSRRASLAALGVTVAVVFGALQIGQFVGVPRESVADKTQLVAKQAAAEKAMAAEDRAANAGLEKTVIEVRQQLHPFAARLLETASGSVQELLLLVAAFAIGDGMRSRRAHLAEVEQRTADLAREERQRASLAVAAERARITRELHDVVAHGMSVMVVQAQGAAAALDRHPERAATALGHVIETGRSSLAEMRRLLAAGRTDPAEDAQLAPQPGIGAVPALVDQLRSAGMRIDLHVEGAPVAAPAAVDLSGYRIVQEALTNTLKHAGPGAAAAVRLEFGEDRLLVEVTDDGAGPPDGADGHGNGLRGIAERVAMLGGALECGRGDAKGFRLRATLPLRAREAALGAA